MNSRYVDRMIYCDGNCEETCSGQVTCPLFFENEDYKYDDPDYIKRLYLEEYEE